MKDAGKAIKSTGANKVPDCKNCSKIKRILLQLNESIFTVEKKIVEMDSNKYHMFFSEDDDGNIKIYLKKKPR